MRFRDHATAVLVILLGSVILGFAVYGFGMAFFVDRN